MKTWREKLLTAFAVILLIGGLGILSYSLLRPKLSPHPLSQLQILKDPAATEQQKYHALLELGKRKDPKVYEIALGFLNDSSSPLLRQGAVLALGFFGDKAALPPLSKTLSDQDEKVQARSLEALAENASLERIKLVNAYLQKPNLSLDEKVGGYLALAQMSRSDDERAATLQELMHLMEAVPASEKEQIFAHVLNLFPDNPAVVALARKTVTESHDETLVAAGIRHLSALRNPWMREKIEDYAKSRQPEVRVASVESIAYACPKDRWTFLHQLLSTERDPNVIEAILKLPLNLKGPNAAHFLKDAIANIALSDGFKKMAEETLAQVQRKPLTNLCHQH